MEPAELGRRFSISWCMEKVTINSSQTTVAIIATSPLAIIVTIPAVQHLID